MSGNCGSNDQRHRLCSESTRSTWSQTVTMGIADSAESYLRGVEASLASLPASASDLANRIWQDIARYGPPLPQTVSVPGIGSFELQAPPPPPPLAPPHWVDTTLDWVGERKVLVASAGLGAAAVVGYGLFRLRRARVAARNARAAAAARGRRRVVVVLGADSALGRQLVVDLEASGYIVIASASSPAAVEELERKAHGYTRVLVLDPAQPDQVPHFVRSLQATLGLRFPTSVAGDPYLSSSASSASAGGNSAPFVYALISLLPLSPIGPAPLEVHKPATYAAHLQRAHTTPTNVVQSLLPLLRTSVGPEANGRSILFAVSSQAIAFSSAFGGPEVATAAANVAAANVLRAEQPDVRILIGHMGDLESSADGATYDAHVKRTSPSSRGRFPYPTTVQSAASALIQAIAPPTFLLDIIPLPRMPRQSIYIGTRARAYAAASYFPEFLRDIILALPAILAGLRNAILPIGPPPRPPITRTSTLRTVTGASQGQRRMIESAPGALQMPEPQTAPAPRNLNTAAALQNVASLPLGVPGPTTQSSSQGQLKQSQHGTHDSDEDASETSSFSGTVSDADLDFESGEDSVVTGAMGESVIGTGDWVSLRDRRGTNATLTGPSSS
ncbi:hypothetical protein BKA62DRAFT_695381 [Auriculariales sp. MPI-PUGE-AT-0066]|nr:hypothetical protein BKA62DRAFT_695381 [Auriculariales sp. MPI-PUGE-AT-0066]